MKSISFQRKDPKISQPRDALARKEMEELLISEIRMRVRKIRPDAFSSKEIKMKL